MGSGRARILDVACRRLILCCQHGAVIHQHIVEVAMESLRRRTVVLALLAAAALAGCAGETSSVRTAAEPELPDWVRMVPATADGKAYYVGGRSIAENAQIGVEMALADAMSQIENKGRKVIRERASLGLNATSVLTVAVEREDFRALAADTYARLLGGIAVQEKVFYAPCGDASSDGPVCQIYVLVTVDLDEWERAQDETFIELGRELSAMGRDSLAEVASEIVRARAEHDALGGDSSH